MGMDYEQRTKAWVDQHYRDSEARGGVGWAHIPDKMDQGADRFEQLIRKHGPRGGRMLEIGCGAGDISLALAPRGLFDEIQGVDISEAAITWANQKAKERGLTVHFRVANMVDLRGFADGSFDAVVSFACLHWVIGEDRANCLASVSRVLRPGGRFYVLTSGRSAEVTERSCSEGTSFDPESGLLMRNGLPYFHLKLPEEILGEMQEAGLRVRHWELDDKEEDDSAYFSGNLIVVAEKGR